MLGCAAYDSGPDADEPDASVSDVVPTFMEPCVVNGTSCEEPYFCFVYNMRGPHCTKECTLDTECEAPSSGCNNMGVCKAP